ncbi:MAG: hypothetical protein ACT4OM_13490 [Actinomycetota bacterium]
MNPSPPDPIESPKPKRRGRRVPAGHEPRPEEVERLLEWTYTLPRPARYQALSDLEGLYWVAVMRLHELRAMTIAELYDKDRFSYGVLAKELGVSRGWIQAMVRKGRAALEGNMSNFPERSQPDKLPPRGPSDVVLPADIRWRLRQAAEAKEMAVDSVALAAIQSYLEALGEEWDQIQTVKDEPDPSTEA